MPRLPTLPPSSALPALLDERSDPDFRRVFGWLCSRSTEVDVALTRIRLSTLDLDPEEVAGLRRLRLLLAEVNAVSLDVEAHALLGDPRRGATLRHLGKLLDVGVIEIRAAPLAGWSPDFTIFGSKDGPEAALLGYHWFQRPFPHRGPALAALHGPEDAARVKARFAEAWARAHDIGSAVVGILERSRRTADGAPGKGRNGKGSRVPSRVRSGLDSPPPHG